MSDCLLNCLFDHIHRALYEMKLRIVLRKLVLIQRLDILSWIEIWSIGISSSVIPCYLSLLTLYLLYPIPKSKHLFYSLLRKESN